MSKTAAEDNGATVTHSSNEHMAAIDSTVEVQYLVTATEDAVRVVEVARPAAPTG